MNFSLQGLHEAAGAVTTLRDLAEKLGAATGNAELTEGDKKMLENTPVTNVDLKSAFVMVFILLILFVGVIYLIKRFYSQKKMRKDYAGMP